jgi:aminodeoxychorismate lyase
MIWIESSSGGHWQAVAAPAIRADDRGLAYGDGLFETVRVREGAPLFLSRHLRRLRGGLEQLAFPPLPWDEAQLVQRCRQAVAHNAIQDGVLKIIVTRGPARRGYEPPVGAQPVLVIQAIQNPKVSETTGVSASLAPWKVDPASPLCYLKHLSALDKVLARQAARQARAGEALFLNLDGHLTEGASSNLFVVSGGQIFTPAVHCGLLPGITRGLLLETYPLAEAELRVQALAGASEAFLTNAAAGVRPLVRFDDQPIGSGEPGPVTGEVAEHYRKLELRELEEGRNAL